MRTGAGCTALTPTTQGRRPGKTVTRSSWSVHRPGHQGRHPYQPGPGCRRVPTVLLDPEGHSVSVIRSPDESTPYRPGLGQPRVREGQGRSLSLVITLGDSKRCGDHCATELSARDR